MFTEDRAVEIEAKAVKAYAAKYGDGTFEHVSLKDRTCLYDAKSGGTVLEVKERSAKFRSVIAKEGFLIDASKFDGLKKLGCNALILCVLGSQVFGFQVKDGLYNRGTKERAASQVFHNKDTKKVSEVVYLPIEKAQVVFSLPR